MSNIKIAGIVNDSITDGVGLRLTIFTQGCPHKCKGCHNPETHDPNGGYIMTSDELIALIDKSRIITGVTLSGGEPLCQAKALIPVAEHIKKRGLNLCVYTGYTFERLQSLGDDVQKIVRLCDVIVDGPFIENQKSYDLKFMGSRNQRPIDVQKTLTSGEITIADGWL